MDKQISYILLYVTLIGVHSTIPQFNNVTQLLQSYYFLCVCLLLTIIPLPFSFLPDWETCTNKRKKKTGIMYTIYTCTYHPYNFISNCFTTTMGYLHCHNYSVYIDMISMRVSTLAHTMMVGGSQAYKYVYLLRTNHVAVSKKDTTDPC